MSETQEALPALTPAQKRLLALLAPAGRHFDYVHAGEVREGTSDEKKIYGALGDWVACGHRPTIEVLERLKLVDRAPHPYYAAPRFGVWTLNDYGRRVVARLELEEGA
jgi:hypothetical protein